MRANQIIEETIRYINDETYSYAILIDGEWGSGKTYFARHELTDAILEEEHQKEKPRKVKYISLYGCKTINDIQETMVFAFAEEASAKHIKKRKDGEKPVKYLSSIVSVTGKVLDGIKGKFFPEVDLYDVFFEFAEFSPYIFIFDDLERCDCPINELFGFINGFVEHGKSKVILVANENEISIERTDSSMALQYLIAANDSIDWPKKPAMFEPRNPKTTPDITELERRRTILFGEEQHDNDYKRVREKLVGSTFRFEPDLFSICTAIVNSAVNDSELKEFLLAHLDDYVQTMKSYSHPNLRTFQFFISKISFLWEKQKLYKDEPPYEDLLKAHVVDNCATSAVRFKSNYKKTETDDIWQSNARNAIAPSIKQYVETGFFDEKNFFADLEYYVDSVLKAYLFTNDPLAQLMDGYFRNSQEWCEEKAKQILQQLKENQYSTPLYQKIIYIFRRLNSMGFTESYINEAKNQMVKNISEMDHPVLIDTHLFAYEDTAFRETLRRDITEINTAIKNQETISKVQEVSDILGKKDWVKELYDYVERYGLHVDMNAALFSLVSPHTWEEKLLTMKPDEIYDFRSILFKMYPVEYKRDLKQKSDIEFLKYLLKKMEESTYEDLIVVNNYEWLKDDIRKILECYGLEE